MKAQDIVSFLEEFGILKSQMKKTDQNWINTPCPLAQWTHASGMDVRPSFGVSVNDEGRSAMYCFGCMPDARSLGSILPSYWLLSGEYPVAAALRYARTEGVDDAIKQLISSIDPWEDVIIKKPSVKIPNSVLRLFPRVQGSGNLIASDCKRFLTNRGIDERVIFECGVRFDELRESVVFPLTGDNADIFLLRERKIDKKEIWTVSQKVINHMSAVPLEVDFPRLTHCGAWFGYDLIDWTKPVVLVEGEIDAMRLKTLGIQNVLASTTSSVTDAQIDALHAPLVYCGYDADKAGKFAHKRIIERLNGVTSHKILDWSLVPSIKGGGQAKDAGDLVSAKHLGVVLRNAR